MTRDSNSFLKTEMEKVVDAYTAQQLYEDMVMTFRFRNNSIPSNTNTTGLASWDGVKTIKPPFYDIGFWGEHRINGRTTAGIIKTLRDWSERLNTFDPNKPILLNIASQKWNVSVTTLKRYIKDGKLESKRKTKKEKHLVLPLDLERYFERRKRFQ